MRKLKKYKPTKFKAKTSVYDEGSADFAVAFIESLCHTKGTWAGKPNEITFDSDKSVLTAYFELEFLQETKQNTTKLLKMKTLNERTVTGSGTSENTD